MNKRKPIRQFVEAMRRSLTSDGELTFRNEQTVHEACLNAGYPHSPMTLVQGHRVADWKAHSEGMRWPDGVEHCTRVEDTMFFDFDEDAIYYRLRTSS